MKVFLVCLVILACGVLGSCNSLKSTLNGYVGQPYTNYVAKNGPSHRSAPIDNGHTVYTYESQWANEYGAYTCIITLRVDQAGVIEGYNYRGCWSRPFLSISSGTSTMHLPQ